MSKPLSIVAWTAVGVIVLSAVVVTATIKPSRHASNNPQTVAANNPQANQDAVKVAQVPTCRFDADNKRAMACSCSSGKMALDYAGDQLKVTCQIVSAVKQPNSPTASNSINAVQQAEAKILQSVKKDALVAENASQGDTAMDPSSPQTDQDSNGTDDQPSQAEPDDGQAQPDPEGSTDASTQPNQPDQSTQPDTQGDE